MRPTQTLSALLLLQQLLLSHPSLSQSVGNETSTPVIKPKTDKDVLATTTNVTLTTVTVTPAVTARSSAQSSNPPPSTTLVQPLRQITTSTTDASLKQSSSSPTTTSSTSEESKTSSPRNIAPTSSSGQTSSSGGKSGDNITTTPATTLGLIDRVTPQPGDLNTSSELPSSTAANSTTSPQQPVTSPRNTESQTEGQHTPTAVTNSFGSMSSTDNSVLSWTPLIPTSTSEVPQSITSQTPGFTTPPVSTPRQPTGSPGRTEVVPTAEDFTHSTPHWTPVVPQDPSTPSHVWTFRNYKIKCDPAIKPAEELLILNLTRASLCGGNPPEQRLLELLCHSVKPSFKPTEDSCALQLAPILENQAVAVKRITIETNLSPKTVFELLKDKWDDLTEVGVSDMRLGKEGPPEVSEDRFSLPLIITIVCMASFLLLVAALYGCCHQRVSQRKDQQRLTEELQTVENGYHDNPTLEVMETPSEMQEKKVVNLNGELGDSWIVPLDNLTKDDLDEEEDTHL